VQSALLSFEPRYAPFLVPAPTFHLTVSLLSLPIKPDQARQAAVDTAVQTLQRMVPRIKQILHGDEGNDAPSSALAAAAAATLSLSLRGVASFNDTVVFADVVRDAARARLSAVASLLADAFEEAGVGCAANKRTKKGSSKKKKHQHKAKGKHADVVMTEKKEEEADEAEESFTPHLTLAKMSRAPAAAGKRGGKFDKRSKHKPHKAQRGGSVPDDAEEANEGAEEGDNDAPMPPPQNPFASLQRDDSVASSVASTIAAAAAVSDVLPPPTPSQPAGDAAAAVGDVSSASSVLVRNPSTSVLRRLDSASYRAFVDTEFGVQPIVSFDLCSMMERKQPDGYYAVVTQVDVSADKK
jgi:2'-5' RNA ligase